MTGDVQEKRIDVYQLVLVHPEGKSPVENLDFQTVLQKIKDSPREDRTWDDVIFEVREIDGRCYLALHKPLSQKFMTLLDQVDGKINDAMDSQDIESKKLLVSTAVAFLEGSNNVVAIAKGSGQSSPGAPALLPFIKELFSTPYDRGKWKLVPMQKSGALEEYEKAKGATKFSIRFETSSDLFNEDIDAGLVTDMNNLSDSVGGDLMVDISIGLVGGGTQDWEAQKKLIKESRKILKGNPKPSKHTVTIRDDPADLERKINLIRQDLFRTISVPGAATESGRFTALFDSLVFHSKELEETVKLKL